jgi:hypothetical protein
VVNCFDCFGWNNNEIPIIARFYQSKYFFGGRKIFLIGGKYFFPGSPRSRGDETGLIVRRAQPLVIPGCIRPRPAGWRASQSTSGLVWVVVVLMFNDV